MYSPPDIDLGEGSAAYPRILVAKGEKDTALQVEVEADHGTPYLLYRGYHIPEGDGYRMAPLIVSARTKHVMKLKFK